MRMFKRIAISAMSGLTHGFLFPTGYVAATINVRSTDYPKFIIVTHSVGAFIPGICPNPLVGGQVWATTAGSSLTMNIPCRQDRASTLKSAIEALQDTVLWSHAYVSEGWTQTINTGVVTGFYKFTQYSGASWYTVSWTTSP